MKPIVVSKEDYDNGNYPKDVPIMVGMEAGMQGKGGLSAGNKKIVIRLKKA